MDFLFKLSVSRRLVVLVGFAVAAMAVLVGVLMTSERAMLLRERQDIRRALRDETGRQDAQQDANARFSPYAR